MFKSLGTVSTQVLIDPSQMYHVNNKQAYTKDIIYYNIATVLI